MKLNNTLNTTGRRQSGGFTLIEMIGVLAVIAILAALLVPKVTQAISDAKVNNAISTYQTIATATASHYSKYNAFNIVTNTVQTIATGAPLTSWDTVALMPEGYLDAPVALKVGTSATLQVSAGEGNEITATGTPGAANGYKLDGVNNGTAANAYTVELVINGIARQDAYDIASRLDGTALAGTAPGPTITTGRVVYSDGATPGVGTAYLYVAGR
jgi:prepilin-type N-terminal cleavage/methylation domain-containing protein